MRTARLQRTSTAHANRSTQLSTSTRPVEELDRPGAGGLAEVLDLQQTAGNQAVVQLMRALASPPPIQRQFVGVPSVLVPPGPTQGTTLKAYLTTNQVSSAGLTFGAEVSRIEKAIGPIQPSKLQEINAEKAKIKTSPGKATEIPAYLQKLDTFVAFMNGLVATYQLDTAATSVGARAKEGGGHHGDYVFEFGTEEVGFNPDKWSRQGIDLLGQNRSGATVRAIVDEAVRDWDTKTTVFAILRERLLGASESIGGSTSKVTMPVPAVFMSSPVGKNYTKIIAAAEDLIANRLQDLQARTVNYEKWASATAKTKESLQASINWRPVLIATRNKLKEVMATDAAASEEKCVEYAIEALKKDDNVKPLIEYGVVIADSAAGTWALSSTKQTRTTGLYLAKKDGRFSFDLNHFKAIVYMEWKVVSDLRKQ